MTESPQIFISYSHANTEFATQLARDLEGKGYSVWLDRTDIKTGSHWDDEIVKGLDASPVFMVLLSKASTASQNVKDEIGYAIDHDKQIVPILLESCEIPFRLRRVQYVDFTVLSYQKGLFAVLEILHVALPGSDHPLTKKEKQTMDPATLAATATGLLASVLTKIGASAVEEVGAKLPEKLERVWAAISDRFKGNGAAAGAASDLVKNAADTDNQAAFALQLKKALKEDTGFADLLADLVAEARGSISNVGDGNITVGNIQIGGDLSGNLTIGNNNQIGG